MLSYNKLLQVIASNFYPRLLVNRTHAIISFDRAAYGYLYLKWHIRAVSFCISIVSASSAHHCKTDMKIAL